MKLCCLRITDWAFSFRSVSPNTKSICKHFLSVPFLESQYSYIFQNIGCPEMRLTQCVRVSPYSIYAQLFSVIQGKKCTAKLITWKSHFLSAHLYVCLQIYMKLRAPSPRTIMIKSALPPSPPKKINK